MTRSRCCGRTPAHPHTYKKVSRNSVVILGVSYGTKRSASTTSPPERQCHGNKMEGGQRKAFTREVVAEVRFSLLRAERVLPHLDVTEESDEND
jgi:hypothetical protein